MTAAAEELAFGARVQLLRERAGKSRAVLAGLVGRSDAWVKSLEKGKIHPPRIRMMDQLARALGVGLDVLMGAEGPRITALHGPGHAALPAVRAALHPPLSVEGDQEAEIRLGYLAERVAAAWRARHTAPDHRTVLGQLLPSLIRDTQYAARVCAPTERRRAQVLVADTMGLAQMYAAYQAPGADLVWRTSDRGLVAATECGNPHSVALAAWMCAMLQRSTGDWDAAMRLLTDAMRLIEPLVADAGPDLLGMLGCLCAEAALTAAVAGAEGRALAHWDQAEKISGRLPESYTHLQTQFSRPLVGFYGVAAAVELRKPGLALRQARDTEASTIMSRPRRASYFCWVARGHQLRADHGTALATVNLAYSAAPETVRYNADARRIILDSLSEPGLRSEARDLALLVGLSP